MRGFISVQKHTILPSPPERGRGAGGEGAKHPRFQPPDTAIQVFQARKKSALQRRKLTADRSNAAVLTRQTECVFSARRFMNQPCSAFQCDSSVTIRVHPRPTPPP